MTKGMLPTSWDDWQIQAERKQRQQRRTPDPFCYLALCRLCGSEVYRHEHIRRKTAKLLDTLAQETKWAWLKHARMVGHDHHQYGVREYSYRSKKGEISTDPVKVLDAMTQTVWLNEKYRHPDLEAGTGEPLPEHMRATTIMKAFGIGQ